MRVSRVKAALVALCVAPAIAAVLPTAALAIDSRITADALYSQANSYPNGTRVGTGQCFSFGTEVFRIVAENAGSPARIGNAGNGVNSSGGGYGYYGCYQQAGGVEVSQAEARSGDYIQIYDSTNPWNAQPTVQGGYSVHTAIIQDNLGGGVFNVIDENYVPLAVARHRFTPANHIASCGGAPWTVAYWRIGSVGAPPPPPPPPTLSSRNLLLNASFENSAGGWAPIHNGGQVWHVPYRNAARSHDGGGFLEMNTSVQGGSVYQDVAVATTVGDSYTFSAWMRSPSGKRISGSLALWGMGGTQENGSTSFTVGPQWTLISVPLDVAQAGHTQLRAQVYMSTPGANYNIDGATFVRGNAAPAPIVASVSNPVAPKTMSRKKAKKVYVTLTPQCSPGGYPVRIYKYRRVSGKWKAKGYVKAKAADYSTLTRCTAIVKLTTKGRWRLRAYAPETSAYVGGWSSGYRYVTVK
jgi:hypothetical protein